MIVYFANVGQRDVKINGGEINRPRIVGKEYLKRFEQLRDQLSLPIVEPGVELALQKSKGEIDKLVLFFTDQPSESTPREHWEGDTLYFADIVEKLIDGTYAKQIRAVEKVPIRENPSGHDRMFSFYQAYFGQFAADHEADIVFCAPAGGTPACNTAMVFSAIRVFTDKVRVVTISESEGAKLVNLSTRILDEYRRRVCLSFLEKYDFGGVSEIMEAREIGSPLALNLARSAQARLSFDFPMSLEFLKQARVGLDHIPEIRRKELDKQVQLSSVVASTRALLEAAQNQIRPFVKEVKPPSSRSSRMDWEPWLHVQGLLVGELYLNAWVKWHLQEYVDFLGRVFRMHEAVLRLIFERQTRYSADSKAHPDDFGRFLEGEGRAFKERLSRARTRPVVSSKSLLKFVSFLAKEGHEEYNGIKKILVRIERLSELRNRSIIAHGYAPVSREQITAQYGNDNPLEDISDLIGLLPVQDSIPYIQALARVIRFEIQTG